MKQKHHCRKSRCPCAWYPKEKPSGNDNRASILITDKEDQHYTSKNSLAQVQLWVFVFKNSSILSPVQLTVFMDCWILTVFCVPTPSVLIVSVFPPLDVWIYRQRNDISTKYCQLRRIQCSSTHFCIYNKFHPHSCPFRPALKDFVNSRLRVAENFLIIKSAYIYITCPYCCKTSKIREG